MILINPFTGIVINANPEGCNQYSGPECAGHVRSLEGSKKALAELARPKTELKYAGIMDTPELLSYFRRHAARNPKMDRRPSKHKMGGLALPGKIHIVSGPRERETALHEIGHQQKGHVDFREGNLSDEAQQGLEHFMELEAWNWAFKNRKKAAISKRKLLQTARAGGIEPWEIKHGKGSVFKR